MPPYICAVWLVFMSTDNKRQMCNLQKCRPCVFSNISTVAFSVGSPLEINNPVPAGQVQFPQFRVIELFASSLATSAVIVGHSSNDFRFFYRTLERQYRYFRLSQID